MALLGSYQLLAAAQLSTAGGEKPTQSQAMGLPGGKIIRAIDGDTTALFLLFCLVFTEPEELSSIAVNGHTTSVGIE